MLEARSWPHARPFGEWSPFYAPLGIAPVKSGPRQLAVQLAFRGRSARRAHHTDGFHASARRAATVAPGVNPPERRASVSAATSHRRSIRLAFRFDGVEIKRAKPVASEASFLLQLLLVITVFHI